MALTFYGPEFGELTEYVEMPQVPAIGDRLHWDLARPQEKGGGDYGNWWTVRHLTWVPVDHGRSLWQAELGLGA